MEQPIATLQLDGDNIKKINVLDVYHCSTTLCRITIDNQNIVSTHVSNTRINKCFASHVIKAPKTFSP